VPDLITSLNIYAGFRFNENIQQRTGPFGKVFVCSCDTNGTQETIFEFNIQKSGNEAERRDTASGASNVADQ